MFKEYDIVVSVRELSKVPKGSIGTILIVYEGESNDYEVEFMDTATEESLNVLTVNGKDLAAASN